ncbi:MAG: hypothetical protein ACOZNI_00980 [Myxococcota bacterium]
MFLSLVACTDYTLKGEPGPRDVEVTAEALAPGMCAGAATWVEVANTGGKPLTVQAVDVDRDDWLAEVEVPFELGPDEVRRIALVAGAEPATVTVASDDADEPVVAVAVGSEPNTLPTAMVLTPYDEESLPADGDYVLTAIVSDDDEPPDTLLLAWSSSLTGAIAEATADPDGFVSTTWPAEGRAAGPQWIDLFATDRCGVPAGDVAFVCQDGPFVIHPITEEGWRFDGVATEVDDTLVLTDGTADAVGGAFDLASSFDARLTEASFKFAIDGDGAEGLALTYLDSARRDGYAGGDGCGLGYGGGADCTSGPALPGFALEIDTRAGEDDCAIGEHVAFTFDGAITEPAACASIPDVEDGEWHAVRLRVTDGVLAVELDGVAVLDAPLDGYVDFQGVVGFTATGGATVRVRDVALTDFVCAFDDY